MKKILTGAKVDFVEYLTKQPVEDSIMPFIKYGGGAKGISRELNIPLPTASAWLRKMKKALKKYKGE